MKLVPLFTALLASATLLHAAEELDFGTDGNVLEVTGNGANKAALEMSDTALVIRGDNFWSIQAIVKDVDFEIGEVSDKRYLEVTMLGTLQDEGPKLRVALLSSDWSKKYEYEFDLTGIDPAEAKTFRATTPLDQPVPAIGDSADPVAPESAAVIDNVLFLTSAELGNKPWDLEIEGLKVVE